MVEFHQTGYQYFHMPYLIDGHNLIPLTKGIDLDQLDDEEALLNILEKYFRRIQRKAYVYFDRAALNIQSEFHSAFLQVRFIRGPASADDAIIHRLRELGGNARNYTVVTSDRVIAVVARSVGASVISSANFARKVQLDKKNRDHPQKDLNPEVNYWLDKFDSNS